MLGIVQELAMPSTGWRRCIGCLIFIGHFPQKSPIISGSFAERILQLQDCYASLSPCNAPAKASGEEHVCVTSPIHIASCVRRDSYVGHDSSIQ